jgi:hypothetical protein
LPYGIEGQLTHFTGVSQSGRRTRLLLSDDVRAAAVLGGFRPIIAVNPTLLERLSPDEIDRIVVHEWVHVQRRDDIAQFAQLAARVIAGWHPAVWWLDRQVQIEREIACDEAVVSLTGSRRQYAACLATLAGLPRGRSLPALGIASPLVIRRVQRIVSDRRILSPGWSGGAAVASVISIAVVAASISAVRLVGLPALQRVLTDVRNAVTVPTRRAPLTDVGEHSGAVRQAQPRREPGIWSANALVQPAPSSETVSDPAVTVPVGDETERPEILTMPPVAAATEPPETSRGFEVLDFSAPSVEDDAGAPLPMPTPDAASSESIPSTWRATTDAGIALGHGSKEAGLATAGFFTRVGRRIAGSF